MNKTEIFKPGDKVYVVDNENYLRHATVVSQEWWDCNKENPVYYNLEDKKHGKPSPCSATGNFHFQDVFRNREDAIRVYNAFSTEKVKLNKVE